MAGKAPINGIREISMHGAPRTREDWMKGREQNDLREIDLSQTTDGSGEKTGHHLGLIVDFTAGVIGLVYEMPGTESGTDAPMLAPPVDWRETNEPRDDSPEAHRKIWEAAQARKAEPAKEPAKESQSA